MLLIGGSSSVGKTTVAGAVAERLGWDVVGTDELLRDRPELDPLAGSSEIWDRAPAELCELLIAGAAAAIPHLIRCLTERAPSVRGLVLEGERIHPELSSWLGQGRDASAVFIVETNAARLHDTLLARSQAFTKLAESRRRAVVEVDRLYGSWLLRETARLSLPCIASQPWDTLAERVLGTMA